MANSIKLSINLYKSNLLSIAKNLSPFTTTVRYFPKGPYLPDLYKDLYNRRIAQGPEVERPRSAWLNWNYDSEIYSFGRRLGEEFEDVTLRRVFRDPSYSKREIAARLKMGLESETMTDELSDNLDFALSGGNVIFDCLSHHLKGHLPNLPNEGIDFIVDYLMSDDVLSYVASNIGMKDVTLSEEFPISNRTLAHTCKALVGGLLKDQGSHRTNLFIVDFILTQLIGKTLCEIWSIDNPMGILMSVLLDKSMSSPEPRLLGQCGTNTMVAAYHVGIYVDKTLIGKGYGETATIAEEMAAKDSLNRIFGLTFDMPPFKTSDNISAPQNFAEELSA